ncbi:MarR family winged helix-turn-helix transcriptional regulator [Halotalea alkalilenta]|uniref:MarR family winged helix-turn-helix transcriptional regulator n=1 Tax=Halotalea alkalilenta TaxID=376489 RepID=UPI00047F1737|nr:MarR family transcriptional regulator [Halotalea alkalilenta]
MDLGDSLELLDSYLWRHWRRNFKHDWADQFTFAEADYLRCIANLGSSRLTDIAHQLGVSKSSASEMLGKLAEHGWVEVEPSESDSRSRLYSLSDKGDAIKQQCLRGYDQLVERLSDSLSQEEFDELNELLARATEIIWQSTDRRSSRPAAASLGNAHPAQSPR